MHSPKSWLPPCDKQHSCTCYDPWHRGCTAPGGAQHPPNVQAWQGQKRCLAQAGSRAQRVTGVTGRTRRRSPPSGRRSCAAGGKPWRSRGAAPLPSCRLRARQMCQTGPCQADGARNGPQLHASLFRGAARLSATDSRAARQRLGAHAPWTLLARQKRGPLRLRRARSACWAESMPAGRACAP